MLAAMAATFLLVPRGFSAGEINIEADKMSWNVRPPDASACHVRCLAGAAARPGLARRRRAARRGAQVTKGTYQLKLLARIPIHNPNFLKVRSWARHRIHPLCIALIIVPAKLISSPATLRVRNCIALACMRMLA